MGKRGLSSWENRAASCGAPWIYCPGMQVGELPACLPCRHWPHYAVGCGCFFSSPFHLGGVLNLALQELYSGFKLSFSSPKEQQRHKRKKTCQLWFVWVVLYFGLWERPPLLRGEESQVKCPPPLWRGTLGYCVLSSWRMLTGEEPSSASRVLPQYSCVFFFSRLQTV